jgi:hypothetical protein
MSEKEQTLRIVSLLRSFHAADKQERLGDTLRRWAEDPIKPRTDKGNLRINPILVLLALIALLMAATFLFFSLVQ